MVSYIVDRGHKVALVGAPPNPKKNPQDCLVVAGRLRSATSRGLMGEKEDECRQIGLGDRALYRDNVGHMSVYGGLAYTNLVEENLPHHS
ncbi:hypothetical protein FVE85_3463 [Porphyridium purpureum]|uniref:Uncharacterized protein n=1 Tax=Porphyridium purpureum TaxID=35688 RepID=A0A5J4YFF3_PORPP|nr:hypothetical protein FVE85_3463 [Porphyridium purpureum]|eukprot:POR5595..scf279_48